MKILFLDIETSPNLAHVWGLWQQNVGLNQLMDVTEVLCWAAKWNNSDDMIFDSVYISEKASMIKRMWYLLDEADIVVHYNGIRFDIPHLNREFLELGITPPSSYKQVDLLQTTKRQFKFPSNKLDYVSQVLGIGKKTSHVGHQLWVKCMANDPAAWEIMETYNKQDVVLLEELYVKLLPWIKGHPNVALYNDPDTLQCTRCGSDKYTKQGFAYTGVSKFQQYKCKECGAWFRGRTNLASRENLAININA